MRRLVVALLALTGCPTPAPVPPPSPDASDAAPSPMQDAWGPMTPCQSSCEQMNRICGPQLEDCVTVMSHIDGSRIKRNPRTGKPLTCMDIVNATTPADMQAIGVHCVPQK